MERLRSFTEVTGRLKDSWKKVIPCPHFTCHFSVKYKNYDVSDDGLTLLFLGPLVTESLKDEKSSYNDMKL